MKTGALTRREVLSATALGLVAAAAPCVARAQRAQTPALTDLGADLVLVEGFGANVVALGTAEGLLLVDGGMAERAAALQQALTERWPGRRVEILFNSNWREEHTGANATTRSAGGVVMAHENTKLWQGGDFFVEWEGRHHSPRPAAELPNKTFYKSGSVDFGGRRVEYWHIPRAHTDGDLAVFFADANVLAASDLVAVGSYPLPDYSTGGWIGGFVEATEALLARTDARTRIVTANGAPCGRAELEAQLAMLTEVRRKIAEAFRIGMSRDDFVASKPTAAFDAQRGDPEQFLRLVYKGAFAHLRELGGVI